jgi:hypothetical protein
MILSHVFVSLWSKGMLFMQIYIAAVAVGLMPPIMLDDKKELFVTCKNGWILQAVLMQLKSDLKFF